MGQPTILIIYKMNAGNILGKRLEKLSGQWSLYRPPCLKS